LLTRAAISSLLSGRYGGTMKGKVPTEAPVHDWLPLPALVGRIAVLGGTDHDKTALLVSLAVQQVHQQGIVLCLDARRYRPTEVQFRLLLRGTGSYLPLPPSGEVPGETAQVMLQTVSRGLVGGKKSSPLLLLDSVSDTPAWEHILSFVLKAGTTVVAFLRSPAELVFGRYDTVLLLRSEADMAEALSRSVGRKVSADELAHLSAGGGVFIHLARVQRVLLPRSEVHRT
jgi:hypothetical protein